MIDGSNDPPESAVKKVARLAPGESYAQARFMRGIEATPDNIRRAKRELMQALSPVVSRAAKLSFARYSMHTIHSHTKTYDLVVAGIIVCEPDLPFDTSKTLPETYPEIGTDL